MRRPASPGGPPGPRIAAQKFSADRRGPLRGGPGRRRPPQAWPAIPKPVEAITCPKPGVPPGGINSSPVGKMAIRGLRAVLQLGMVHRCGDGDVSRCQPPRRAEKHIACLEIQPGGADEPALRHVFLQYDPVSFPRHGLLNCDCACSLGNHGSGKQPDRFAGSESQPVAATGWGPRLSQTSSAPSRASSVRTA